MYYIFVEDGKLNGAGQAQIIDENVINYEVDEALYNAYLENKELYIWDGKKVIKDPDYYEKQAKKEKERIQELYMTRSDFFDGTIDAWGVGEDELLLLVQRMLLGLPLENNQKLKAINNFKNALNFYRKHDLFKMLIGAPIQLTETMQVVITEESLDKYFDEVNKGNKKTAWQYLPQPTAIPIEPIPEIEPVPEIQESTGYDDL